MALSAKLLPHSVGRSTAGTQAYTGYGFQPKALILFGVNSTVISLNPGQNAPSFIGFAADNAGTTQQAVISGFSDEMQGNPAPESGGTRQSSANAGKQSSSSNCVQMLQSGNPAVLALAALSTWDTDGYTLNWSDPADLATRRFLSLAFGGSDITNVAVKSHVAPTATGTQSYTVLDQVVAPDVVFFMNAIPLITGSSAVDDVVIFGWSLKTPGGTIKHGSIAFFDNDGSASMTSAVHEDAILSVLVMGATGGVDGIGTVTALNTDGTVSVNWTDAPSVADRNFYTLAIRGGKWDTQQLTAQAGTGTQTFGGFAFQPKGALLASTGRAASGWSNTVVDAVFSLGATDGTNQGVISNMQQDGNTSSYASRSHLEDAVIHKLSGTAKTTVWRGAFSAFTTDGVTLSWSTGQANKFQTLVLTDSPPAGVTETPTPGGALAAGSGPIAAVASPVGGAPAAGAAPSAAAPSQQGGAPAAGIAPATSAVAVAAGGAVAAGTSPVQPVSETPAPGGALAAGSSPSASTATLIGGATAAGTTATAHTSVPVGGASAAGAAPSTSVPTQTGGVVAGGQAATARTDLAAGGALAAGQPAMALATAGTGTASAAGIGAGAATLLAAGGAVASGNEPSVPGAVTETPTPGGALAGGNAAFAFIAVNVGGADAAGISPLPAVAVVIQGATAAGVPVTLVLVPLAPGGGSAGGQPPGENIVGVHHPGFVTLTEAAGTSVALTDTEGPRVALSAPTGGTLTLSNED